MATLCNINWHYDNIKAAYEEEILEDVKTYLKENADIYFDINDEFANQEGLEETFDEIWCEMAASDEVCGNGLSGYPEIDVERVACAFFHHAIGDELRSAYGNEPFDFSCVFGQGYNGYVYYDCILRSFFYSELIDKIKDIFYSIAREMYDNLKNVASTN